MGHGRPAGIGACWRHGLSKTVAQFLPGENHDAHFPEVLIAAGVVRVDMGVDHETDGAVGDLVDGRYDLVGEWSELRVHHESAIRAGEHADHAALSFECVEIASDLSGLDLNLAEVGLRLRIRGDGQYGQGC